MSVKDFIIWDDIKVGDKAGFKTIVSQEKIADFIALFGDNNLLHKDKEFAEQKGFVKPVAHGMLLASFFSALVGNNFLKNHNLYLSQNVQFRKPVFIDEEIEVTGEVTQKISATKVLIIKTLLFNQAGQIAVSGEAMVKFI